MAIALIIFGLGWFITGIPQAKPLVDGLWALNDELWPMEAGLLRILSTIVHNLWNGIFALPVSPAVQQEWLQLQLDRTGLP